MTLVIKPLGHASFQIKTRDKTIYIDLKKYGKTVATTEKADLILVTHRHGDHCDVGKINKLRKEDATIIAPKQLSSKIPGKVMTLKPGEETETKGITVKAVEAYNTKRFRSPGKPWHPKGYGVGYLVTVEGKTVYHAGDTDFIPEMRKLGHVDVALLPTGDKYTMDNIDAAEAAAVINPGIAIPMHKWDTDPQQFKEKTEAKSNVKVVLLKDGEELNIA